VIETGWAAVPEELPAAREGRTLAEVLAGTSNRRDRDAQRAEQLAEANRAAEASMPDTRQWVARITGQAAVSADEVLARQASAPERGSSGQAELRRAREILSQHGLDHVLPGRIDAVLDANMGYLGSPRYQPDAAVESDFGLQRAREELTINRHWMAMYRDRVAVRSGKARPPFGEARRSEPVTCEGCLQMAEKEGIPPEELPALSFRLHHSDIDGNLLSAPADRPVRVPDEQRSARYGREITRVAGEGQLGDVFGRVVA
jgi:hypothetical protein